MCRLKDYANVLLGQLDSREELPLWVVLGPSTIRPSSAGADGR
jgi:hypothetical protein